MVSRSPADPALRPRVLIIEDHVDTADSTVLLLEMRGYSARAANDGASGLAVAAQFEPHFIILDMWMPGLHGSEVARHLRANARDLPVQPVLIGTTGDDVNYQKFEKMFDHRLRKPLDALQLLAVLQDEWAKRFSRAA